MRFFCIWIWVAHQFCILLKTFELEKWVRAKKSCSSSAQSCRRLWTRVTWSRSSISPRPKSYLYQTTRDPAYISVRRYINIFVDKSSLERHLKYLPHSLLLKWMWSGNSSPFFPRENVMSHRPTPSSLSFCTPKNLPSLLFSAFPGNEKRRPVIIAAIKTWKYEIYRLLQISRFLLGAF